MNKVILMGRLTRDPEVRYSQAAEPVAVVRITLAVNRRFKRPNEPDADFIDCVAFGKTAEFIEKYFNKGKLISIVGSIRVSTWDDKEGQKHWKTEVVIEETYFGESKAASDARSGGSDNSASQSSPQKPAAGQSDGFFAIDQSLDDEDLPF